MHPMMKTPIELVPRKCAFCPRVNKCSWLEKDCVYKEISNGTKRNKI